MPRVVRAWSIR